MEFDDDFVYDDNLSQSQQAHKVFLENKELLKQLEQKSHDFDELNRLYQQQTLQTVKVKQQLLTKEQQVKNLEDTVKQQSIELNKLKLNLTIKNKQMTQQVRSRDQFVRDLTSQVKKTHSKNELNVEQSLDKIISLIAQINDE